MIEVLHDTVCGMARDAVVRFVENEQSKISHADEAVYQGI
jgi:hypothetical protein